MSNATAKQVSFYNSLLDQIVALGAGEFSDEVVAVAREGFPTRTVAEASEAIERAKRTLARLKAATPAPAAPAAPVTVQVPSGHYALVEDGVTKFYKVDVVTEGKWAGRTFVNAQGSDEYYPIRNAAHRASILAAIAADPKAALVRYGHAIGKCGVCNRTLTDEASRAAGIGPVCAGRL